MSSIPGCCAAPSNMARRKRPTTTFEEPCVACGSTSVVSSQSAAYLLGVVASPGEEASAPRPLRPVERVRGPESAPERPFGRIAPRGIAIIETGGTDFVLDSPDPELLSNSYRPVTSFTTGGDVLFCEAPIRQPVPGTEIFEHPLNRLRVEPARRELASQFGVRVLATCKQFERLSACPLERIVSAQASTSSALAAFASSLPSSRSRSAESRLVATSSCSLRKLRTLSRPCPMRSPR